LIYRNIGSWFIKKINQMAFNLPANIQTSGFRLMCKELAMQIIKKKSVNPSLSVLILGVTRNIISLPVIHEKRAVGHSNYTLSKQFRLALDNICNSTMAPLRFVSTLGIGFCIISGFMVLYYLYRFFAGQIGIQGWTTLVILVSFFSGIILLSLGVIGEYLVRVLREVSPAPPYLVRNKTCDR